MVVHEPGYWVEPSKAAEVASDSDETSVEGGRSIGGPVAVFAAAQGTLKVCMTVPGDVDWILVGDRYEEIELELEVGDATAGEGDVEPRRILRLAEVDMEIVDESGTDQCDHTEWESKGL